MPAPIAVGIAGLLGLAAGYVIDQVFGDGDYTPREMFISTATSMIGGGLLRPIGQTLSRGGRVLGSIGDDVYKVGASAYDDIITAGYIFAPLVSKPARRELIGGVAAGFVYDIAYGQSSGSSSEQNGTHVGPGGTRSRDMVEPNFNKARNVTYDNRRSMFCPEGYELRKVNKKWMCVRIRK
jgi:hypothetical protein